MDFDTTEDERVLSGLCYPLWMIMAWFLLFNSRPFVKYHAMQSLVAGLLSTLLYGILWAFFGWSSNTDTANANLSYGVVMMVWFCALLFIGMILFTVFMVFAWKAWQGQSFRIPLLALLAEKYARS